MGKLAQFSIWVIYGPWCPSSFTVDGLLFYEFWHISNDHNSKRLWCARKTRFNSSFYEFVPNLHCSWLVPFVQYDQKTPAENLGSALGIISRYQLLSVRPNYFNEYWIIICAVTSFNRQARKCQWWQWVRGLTGSEWRRGLNTWCADKFDWPLNCSAGTSFVVGKWARDHSLTHTAADSLEIEIASSTIFRPRGWKRNDPQEEAILLGAARPLRWLNVLVPSMTSIAVWSGSCGYIWAFWSAPDDQTWYRTFPQLENTWKTRWRKGQQVSFPGQQTPVWIQLWTFTHNRGLSHQRELPCTIRINQLAWRIQSVNKICVNGEKKFPLPFSADTVIGTKDIGIALKVVCERHIHWFCLVLNRGFVVGLWRHNNPIILGRTSMTESKKAMTSRIKQTSLLNGRLYLCCQWGSLTLWFTQVLGLLSGWFTHVSVFLVSCRVLVSLSSWVFYSIQIQILSWFCIDLQSYPSLQTRQFPFQGDGVFTTRLQNETWDQKTLKNCELWKLHLFLGKDLWITSALICSHTLFFTVP